MMIIEFGLNNNQQYGIRKNFKKIFTAPVCVLVVSSIEYLQELNKTKEPAYNINHRKTFTV
tara:strand:- start:321 stop:503 length:183 start_codon:yes stop_codon:yes gene_type:complete